MESCSEQQSFSVTHCSIATNFSVPAAINPSWGYGVRDYKTHARIIQQLTNLGMYDVKYGWKPESVAHYIRLSLEKEGL